MSKNVIVTLVTSIIAGVGGYVLVKLIKERKSAREKYKHQPVQLKKTYPFEYKL